ncbi:MAG: hypothetical protein OXE86_09460 [Alphaproteobacteria bacterium]|nr:hypothetical protein [Alphaproteobacteria bacterium]
MAVDLQLPLDELTGQRINVEQAADYLELRAFCASDGVALVSDFANQIRIAVGPGQTDLHEELTSGQDDLVSGTVNCIERRCRTLRPTAYPFRLDERGDSLSCGLTADSIGHAAYVLCLVLSNLRALSTVLTTSGMHPDEQETRRLRELFQYCATAALAAELGGHAWSFGAPRPGHSGFLLKLRQIWNVLGDGSVGRQPGAPTRPQDDQVDVFAARTHPDRHPGFLFAAAQVATGANANNKSLRGHLDAFWSRWFVTQPVTSCLVYMIVPFAMRDEEALDFVRTMGNTLHRLRVPRLVTEACALVRDGRTIEGYACLQGLVQWAQEYQARARTVR